MKIYTKKGDDGTTALTNGLRVRKSDARIDAYGTVDELNSHIGVLSASLTERDADLQTIFSVIQNKLFVVGSCLATPPDSIQDSIPHLDADDIVFLEHVIDRLDGELEPLQQFILPGGCASAAQAHVARCVCRRAERMVIALQAQGPVEAEIVQYLNRLSDLLFVAARFLNHTHGVGEPRWNGGE